MDSALPNRSSSDAAPRVSVRRETLENGLRILLLERPDLPILSLTLMVPAGLLWEQGGEEGLSQFSVSLLSHGTERRDAVQLAEDVDTLGATLGIHANHDYADLGLSCRAEDMEIAIEILAEVATRPAYRPDEIERRRSDLLSAIRRREDDHAQRVRMRMGECLFAAHPYRNPALGNADVVASLSEEQLRGFYERTFQPNGSILAVVGAFRSDALLSSLKRHFEPWRSGTERALELPEIPPPARRVETLQKDEVVQATIRFGRVGIPRNHPDHVPLLLANFVLGGSGFGSRLMHRLREDGGLTYGAQSGFQSWRLSGVIHAGLQTSLPNMNEAIAATLEEIRRVYQEGITEDELAWAKRYFTGSLPLAFRTNDQVASLVLAQELYGLPEEYWLEQIEEVETATQAKVSAAARTYFDPDLLTLVVLADFRKITLAAQA